MKNTTVCYIEKDGRYLMLHRTKKKNDTNSGKWIGIGGKIEKGETPLECIKREVKEETGLTLNNPNYRGIINFVSDVFECETMHLFTADSFEGKITECDEGDLKWIDKTALSEYPMWEGDALFLKQIETDAGFFELTLTYKGDKLISHELKSGN